MKLLAKTDMGTNVHIYSQTVYILASFWLFAQQRPFYQWPAVVLMVAFFYGLEAYFIRKKHAEYAVFPITGLAIANSLFLNLDSTYLWVYLLAGFIGVLSIVSFSSNGRHAFNPSIVGSFAMITFFPQFALHASWAQDYRLMLLILCAGIFTVLMSRRWRITIWYFLGFVFFSLFAYGYRHLFPGGTSDSQLSLLFWPSLLTNPATLIFAFHVISDPQTSPQKLKQQAVFGFAIGALEVVLRGFGILNSDFISYLTIQSVQFALASRTLREPRVVEETARQFELVAN
jgi:hypothetical protein